MPSLEVYKQILTSKSKSNSIGSIIKDQSDFIMEQTWDNDVQSKECYIYDMNLDDQPDKNYGMTYEHTTKIPIDAKFIVSSYQSLAKDIVDYHLMFKPSQKTSDFDESDSLYWYQERFTNRYGSRNLVGSFVDCPNEKGIYEKWLICQIESANQFIKYLILPCNYNFRWISYENGKRVIHRSWGVSRQQMSYNSGVYRKYNVEYVENQDKCWLPINPITEELYYTDDERHNQRLFISAPTKHPIVYRVSKVENHSPIGLQKLTVVQDFYNPSTDYIDWDAIKGGDTYAMYADYFSSSVVPENSPVSSSVPSISCSVSASTNQIKVGGTYRTLTATFIDPDGNDITSTYLPLFHSSSWSAFIDGVDITKNTELINWRTTDDPNIIKVKFGLNKNYLTKQLIVQCEVSEIIGKIFLEIVGL